jgi:hypothetical protein
LAQPLSYSRTLFITSDNLDSILEAKAYANSKGLPVLYSHDIPRMPHGNQADQVSTFWTSEVTISVLMQLVMTSECAAWVGSRCSNWNRIIDMYRCVRVPQKCHGAFIEAGDTPPGFYDARPLGYM